MSALDDIDNMLGLSDDGPARGVDASYRVTASELRNFVERYERVQAEKVGLMEIQKEIMAEAKSRGYDTKVIKIVIAQRKRDADDLAEEGAVLEMYREAMGM